MHPFSPLPGSEPSPALGRQTPTMWYNVPMTPKLKNLLERAETWPEAAQDDLVQSMIEIETRYTGIYRLSDDERAGVEKGLADMRAGRFATDEEVAAVFKPARA